MAKRQGELKGVIPLVGFLAYELVLGILMNTHRHPWSYILDVLFYFLATYILRRFPNLKGYRIIGFILSCILIIGLFVLAQYIAGVIISFRTGKVDFSIGIFGAAFAAMRAGIIIVFSVFNFYYRYGIQMAGEAEKAKVLKLEAENELKEARLKQMETTLSQYKTENDLLRAQIGPHFIISTLNHIYTKVRKISTLDAEIVYLMIQLSRFAISSEPDGKVALKNELNQVDHHLRMFELINGFTLHYEKELEDIENIRIVPMLLLTPLENMLKHGCLNKEEDQPILIIKYKSGQLSMSLRNTKEAQASIQNTKIGLQNMRQRLEREYPGKFLLDVNEDAKYFQLNLNIKIE